MKKTYDVIGLTYDQAVKKYPKMRIRIRKEDGVPFMGTCDFRLDRINVEILNGKIVASSMG
jgi:hypothetical protein